MDKRGIHDKYRVERTDGKPIEGMCLVIELDKDPQAVEIIESVSNLVQYTRPEWAKDLRGLAEAKRYGH